MSLANSCQTRLTFYSYRALSRSKEHDPRFLPAAEGKSTSNGTHDPNLVHRFFSPTDLKKLEPKPPN